MVKTNKPRVVVYKVRVVGRHGNLPKIDVVPKEVVINPNNYLRKYVKFVLKPTQTQENVPLYCDPKTGKPLYISVTHYQFYENPKTGLKAYRNHLDYGVYDYLIKCTGKCKIPLHSTYFYSSSSFHIFIRDLDDFVARLLRKYGKGRIYVSEETNNELVKLLRSDIFFWLFDRLAKTKKRGHIATHKLKVYDLRVVCEENEKTSETKYTINFKNRKFILHIFFWPRAPKYYYIKGDVKEFKKMLKFFTKVRDSIKKFGRPKLIYAATLSILSKRGSMPRKTLVQEVARATGRSERTVYKAVTKLKSLGLVEAGKRSVKITELGKYTLAALTRLSKYEFGGVDFLKTFKPKF